MPWSRPAPTSPKISWPRHISGSVRRFTESIYSIQSRYQLALPDGASVGLGNLVSSPLLTYFESLATGVEQNEREGINHPVINISLTVLQGFMADILGDIRRVEESSRVLGADVVPRFPVALFRTGSVVAPHFGDARYDGEPGPAAFFGREPPMPRE